MVMLNGCAREGGPSSFLSPLRYSSQTWYSSGGGWLGEYSGRRGSDPPNLMISLHTALISSSTAAARTDLSQAPAARYRNPTR